MKLTRNFKLEFKTLLTVNIFCLQQLLLLPINQAHAGGFFDGFAKGHTEKYNNCKDKQYQSDSVKKENDAKAKAREGNNAAIDKTSQSTNNASDPCTTGEFFELTSKMQIITSAIYAAAAITCTSECFSVVGGAGTACTVMSWVGLGADVAGVGYVAMQADSFAEGASTAYGNWAKAYGLPASAVAASMFGGDKLASMLTKDGATKADKAKAGACAGAIINGAQATVRFANSFIVKNSADDEYNKVTVLAADRTQVLNTMNRQEGSNGSSTSGPAGGEQKDHQNKVGDLAKKEEKTPQQKLSENYATAMNSPIMKNFEKLTGHSGDELANQIANGVPPLVAAGQMAASQLGENPVAAVAAVQDQSKNVVDQIKDEIGLKNKGLELAYESTANRAPSSKKGHDDGLGDFGALMAGLMPGQKAKDDAAQGSTGLKFSAAQTQAAAQQGLHTSEKSLFTVVGSRYQQVTSKFLTGDNLVGQPQPLTVLPNNPYLSK